MELLILRLASDFSIVFSSEGAHLMGKGNGPGSVAGSKESVYRQGFLPPSIHMCVETGTCVVSKPDLPVINEDKVQMEDREKRQAPFYTFSSLSGITTKWLFVMHI